MRLPRIPDALARHGVGAAIAGVAVFWLTALTVIAIVRYGGDYRALLCLGELVRHPAALDGVPRNSLHGYDGQFYAALATDPLLLHAGTVELLDAPAYRATRVLLPGAAYVLALGNDRAAVHAYLWLGWGLAIAALGIVAAWLRGEGRTLWWTAALAVSGGLVISIVRATPDAAALALLLAALALQRRGRTAWAVVAIAASVLARETSLLALPALAWAELQRRRPVAALSFLAAPLAAFLAWQSRFWFLFGVRFEGTGNFSTPFSWLPAKLTSLVGAGGAVNWMELFGVMAITAAMACLVALLTRPREIGPVEGTFVAFALLGVFLNDKIYGEAYSYGRVLIALPFLAVFSLGRQTGRGRRLLLQAVVILFALVGIVALRGELRSEHFRAARQRLTAPAAPATPAPILPEPDPTPTVAPPVPAPPAPALFLLPAARLNGHDNARWRTELVLENPSELPVRLQVELLLAGSENARPPLKEVTLAGHGRVVSGDVLGDMFAAEGAGALRVRSDGPQVQARLRTYDAARKAPRGPFLAARPVSAALAPGHPAVLRNLANDTDTLTRKRSHVGMLNVGSTPVGVEITVRGMSDAVLGRRTLTLRPSEFRQLNDIFLALGAGGEGGGSVTVATTTPGGAVLAYATVVRRQPPGVTYVTP